MPYGRPLHMCDNLRSFEDKMKIKQFFKDLSKFTLQLRYLFVAIWSGEIVFNEDGRVGCRDLAIGIKPEIDPTTISVTCPSGVVVEIINQRWDLERQSAPESTSNSEPERRAIGGPDPAIGQDA